MTNLKISHAMNEIYYENTYTGDVFSFADDESEEIYICGIGYNEKKDIYEDGIFSLKDFEFTIPDPDINKRKVIVYPNVEITIKN